jgi:hypothetical protein
VLARRTGTRHYAVVLPLLFAQSMTEYSGLSSKPVLESLKELWSNLTDGLKGVDQTTWMVIGGVLLVLLYLTRRTRRR